MPPLEEQAPIEIAHFGSSIWSYRRRTTGAILIETRPERMIRSAWRGEARSASAPKRARSYRAVTIEIGASIAQQASPKVSGKIEFERAQFWRSLSFVVT